ncbi:MULTISPECIES: hypothetical protein [unclassified Prochlorococcus]|nr:MULTISPECIES: hypothetical protein [unclassified Prochlorococcus]KGG15548.1 hypothetical protein EV06_1422 [Prochlorococcus sp. MIT 0602]KGG17828.1 hypothetical protein EV07_1270 [Prochlorococcus sp. MIT 0603]
MPTKDDFEAAKAHLKDVDKAQEDVLEAMFDELRSDYDLDLSENKLDT